MSFGQNLQFLRKMNHQMTQEELAEKLNVSRQTISKWELDLGIDTPEIIGWDFPAVSQEQINVYNMHGYAAALILREKTSVANEQAEILSQEAQTYITITIRDPLAAPFRLIPNAYKVLMTHMTLNGIRHKEDKEAISCFEKEYDLDGIHYMDVSIRCEDSPI